MTLSGIEWWGGAISKVTVHLDRLVVWVAGSS